MSICPKCGIEFGIGDWPFCDSPGGHGPLRETQARRFEKIMIWQSNTDPDHYSFPGRNDEPCPAEYHPIEITNLSEADQIVSRINDVERRKAAQMRDLNYAALDEQTKRRRDDIAAHIRGNSRAEALFRQVREWGDRVRDQKRSKHHSLDPHFHIQVLSFNSGNRNSYSDPETGWKEKKS